MIDILSLIQQKANIELAGRPTRHFRNGTEYHSNCPFCSGRDRFAIYPDINWYTCSIRSSGCGKHGDAVQFLRDYEGLSFRQACTELDIDYRYPEEARTLPLFMTKDEAPPEQWSESALDFMTRAERYLWTEKGKKALAYLYSRGLTDETIKRAKLGYCPDWYTCDLKYWGITSSQTDEKEIKIPSGITFSYFVGNDIWKIQIKRFEYDNSYFQVTGSSDCLYGIDELKPNQNVLLVEGEFDKFSIEQEAGETITPIATGGASKGQSTRWIAKLKTASHVLIGFDLDENKAGDEGATFWQQKLPNSTRWTPWAHDVNQMLTTGLSIKTWVELGLKSVQTTIAPAPVVEPVQFFPPALLNPPVERSAGAGRLKIHDWTMCKTCGKPAIAWKNSDGYCRECCPWQEQLRPKKPILPCTSCGDKPICIGRNKQHIRARWIWYEKDHTWICNNCYSPANWTQ